MKKNLFILLLFFLGIGLAKSSAQVYLSFAEDPIYQDTVLMESTQEFSFLLENTGTDTLNEVVEIFMSITNQQDITSTASMGVFMAQDSLLLPGQIMPITFVDTISSLRYTLGDNVVVIWPGVAKTPIGHQTFTSFINVANPITIEEIVDNVLVVYPNPMKEQALMQLPHNEKIESLRLMNVMGTVVLEEPMILVEKPLLYRAGLKEGVYFLELRSKGKLYQQKLIIN